MAVTLNFAVEVAPGESERSFTLYRTTVSADFAGETKSDGSSHKFWTVDARYSDFADLCDKVSCDSLCGRGQGKTGDRLVPFAAAEEVLAMRANPAATTSQPESTAAACARVWAISATRAFHVVLDTIGSVIAAPGVRVSCFGAPRVVLLATAASPASRGF